MSNLIISKIKEYKNRLKELTNTDSEVVNRLHDVLGGGKANRPGKKNGRSVAVSNKQNHMYSLDYKALLNNRDEYWEYIHRIQKDYDTPFIKSLDELHEQYDLSGFESHKEELIEKKGFLLTATHRHKINEKTGKPIKAVGMAYPTMVAMHYFFDEIFFVSIEIINHFFGVKDIGFVYDMDLLAHEKLVKLLEHMETKNISDLHFYKITDFHYNITARFRDTVLPLTKDDETVNAPVAEDLVRAILTEARVDPFTKMVETKALIQKELLTGMKRNFRVSIVVNTVGSSEGKSVSIRKLASYDSIKSLEKLGYASKTVDLLNDIIMLYSKKGGQENGGIIIVSGATNSGKTTLLYTLLMKLRNERRRIFTIENPVEITVPDVIQLDLSRTESAEEKNKLTIEKAKNIILRQDPDVSLVSEVRAKEEMHTVFELANTGHLAFTTIHANNCRSTLKRIQDIGQVESDTMNLLTKMVVNQSLVKKVCQTCKGKAYLESGERCGDCNLKGNNPDPGYSGRLPLYEIAYFKNVEIGDDIMDFEKLKQEEKMLHVTKQEVARELYKQGLIDDETLDQVEGTTAKGFGMEMG